MVDMKKQEYVDSDCEIKIEIVEEVHQKSLHQCDYAAIDPSDQETYDGDLQTKIEVEEDFVLKTESSDLSEFIDQCNWEDVKSEDETLQEDNIDMENMNPDIRAKFFPQLCLEEFFLSLFYFFYIFLTVFNIVKTANIVYISFLVFIFSFVK